MPTNPQLAPLIDRFEAGATTPAAWIRGANPDQLRARPVPGKWSLMEVVLHVLDSDLAAGHRFRRIVAEESPLLIAYDETLFAARLSYHDMEPGEVVALFELHRRFTARWLRTVPHESFERAGIHNQRGKVTLAQFVKIYIDHLTHHEAFVKDKRRALALDQ
jgi:uncharacterized damage-inducible protein DinB